MTDKTTPSLAEVIALSPCPFCGRDASIFKDGGNEVYSQSFSVGCTPCGMRTKEWASNSWASNAEVDEAAKLKAIKAWNRRTSAASLRDEDARDAARYRGLRDALLTSPDDFIDALNFVERDPKTPESFDSAIDAAIATQPAAQERQA